MVGKEEKTCRKLNSGHCDMKFSALSHNSQTRAGLPSPHKYYCQLSLTKYLVQ